MLEVCKRLQRGGQELQDRADFFWHGSNLFTIIADGAGGMSGGAEAAEFTVGAIRQRISSTNADAEALCRLLSIIDCEMARAGAYGETTCVIVAITEAGLVGTSVGDSGAWIISDSNIDNLTVGQSRKPFVGSGRASPVGFHRGPLQGTLLLASDGLLKYASAEQIAVAAGVSDLEQAGNELIKLVQYQSGALPDDVSVILVRGA